MTVTPHLALPLIAAAQAQKHVTHNEAVTALDALVQLAVLDRDLSLPPPTPGEGDRYIVAGAGTGAWAGKGGQVAMWQDGAWRHFAPSRGFLGYVLDEGMLVAWSGTAWVDALSTISAFHNLALLGLGTTADATNPFSAKVNKALWTAKSVAEGGTGDLRYTMNKESAAKTLSLLFQTAFSGRAEIGLTGDDDLHIKVSADGAAWTEAIRVSRSTGVVSFPAMGGPREVLSADRTYYVRTDGSDANTGVVDSAAGAFLTIQKAIDTATKLDLNGFNLTVQVRAGTYAGEVTLKNLLGAAGTITLAGDEATPANVTLARTSGDCVNCVNVTTCTWNVAGFKFTNTGGNGINVSGGGTNFAWRNVEFGACSGIHVNCTAGAFAQGGASRFTGGATIGFWGAGGNIQTAGVTFTYVNPITYTARNMDATEMGYLNMWGMTFVNPGNVTGKRYEMDTLGLIFTNGGGANYFPGTVAGTTANGAVYV